MNALYTRIYDDDHLNPSHIAVYMSLFQFWNLNRFVNPFRVARGEVMKLSKINSPATYRKCVKELQQWHYIDYIPSHNPFKGSQFSIVNIWSPMWPNIDAPIPETAAINEPAMPRASSLNKQVITPSKTNKPYNQNKECKPSNESEVIDFFLQENSTKNDALKFWNHYEANGWKAGGKAPIENWKAAARKWILNTNTMKLHRPGQKMNNLHTTTKKNYHEPL